MHHHCPIGHLVKCVTLPSASPCQVHHTAKCITLQSASHCQVHHLSYYMFWLFAKVVVSVQSVNTWQMYHFGQPVTHAKFIRHAQSIRYATSIRHVKFFRHEKFTRHVKFVCHVCAVYIIYCVGTASPLYFVCIYWIYILLMGMKIKSVGYWVYVARTSVSSF